MTAADPHAADEIRAALQDLRIELAILTHRVAARVGLRETDLACLDVIHRGGPLTPTRLAARVGIHLATMTGILSRLERQGWIRRTPDPHDRRSSLIELDAARAADLEALFADATARLGRVTAALRVEEAKKILRFLTDSAAAAREAGDALARGPKEID